MKIKPTRLHGVLTALVTPMKANGEIHLAKLERFVEHQIGQGIHGLIPLGSTGEFYALSPAERQGVLETTLGAAAGRVPVVAGANAGSTREVVAFARQAEQLGCAGVLLAAPFYSLPTPDELFAHFRAVNDAIGIPIMLYNYPGRTGVDMSPEFIAGLTVLENVRYVKESTGEMSRMTTLMRLCGDRLGVFCGCDTIAFESFMVGALGWVGGVANVLPASHARLYELSVVKQDYAGARKLFFEILPTLELMEGGGKYTQWVKAACAILGRDVGIPRQPLGPASKAETAILRHALRQCAEGKKK
ncbi:MAG: 4-hydroxy-tetrahydrodipicolinate synthase [Verrucomicrobiota bacterium]